MDRQTFSIGTDNQANNLVDQKRKRVQDDLNQFASALSLRGLGDIDMWSFVTDALTNLVPITARGGAGHFGTVGIQQDSWTNQGKPVYAAGKPVPTTRTGRGVSFNVVQPGQKPDSWTMHGKKVIQRRYKVYYGPTGTTADGNAYIWRIKTALVDQDYVLQTNEKLDGGFLPQQYVTDFNYSFVRDHSKTYGNSFPVGTHGGLQYSFSARYDKVVSNQLGDVRETTYYNLEWSGIVNEAETSEGEHSSNPASATYYPSFGQVVVTGLGLNYPTEIRVGGYHCSIYYSDRPYPGGSEFYGPFDYRGTVGGDPVGTAVAAQLPTGIEPGTYDVIFVGQYGDVHTFKNIVTIPEPS